MFGGLHIEMAALNSIIGTLLHHSGWTSARVKEGIVSSGTAEAYLSASSVTRTRQAHQITACCLYKLRKSACDRYSRDASKVQETFLTLKSGVRNEDSRVPQFAVWILILAMELAILTLIRSFREADFVLYRKVMPDLIQ